MKPLLGFLLAVLSLQAAGLEPSGEPAAMPDHSWRWVHGGVAVQLGNAADS